ncbi:MAG: exopolyphosphatase [Brotaphodocola sp.]
MVRIFAAIDVGSFELELGIYEISDKNGIQTIDHLKHVMSLGSETHQTGRISYGSVEEICAVLNDFQRIMKGYQVQDYRAYATSAFRESNNSQIVLDQIRVRTGIEIRIISNSEQRFICHKAIAAKDALFQKVVQEGTAIVDVGFGSMQVSLFDQDALSFTQNLPLGILRIRELLIQAKVSSDIERILVSEMVDNELVTFRKMYLKNREIQSLIAIGEPILSLHLRGLRESREQIKKAAVDAVYEKLSRMTQDQIEEEFQVSAGFAPVLFPTAAIYKRVMEITGAETLWIPGIRLVDGIAADYAEIKKLLKFNHSFADDIIATARGMAQRYKCHMSHVRRVEQAALQMFDCLKKYHGLKERERLLLQIAANLHTCGNFVAMRDANESAYSIIMATEIIGLSHLEREIVADVVRYQTKSFRYDVVHMEARMSVYSRLTNPQNPELTIAKLIAILRLASSMDQSHQGKLADCRMTVRDNHLIIGTDYAGDVTLEAMAIEAKSEFFEEIYGIRPVLKQTKKV